MPRTHREVTSAKNPVVQQFRDAATGAAADHLLAEGARLVGEALDAGREVVVAAVGARCDEALRTRLQASAAQFLECSDQVLAALSSLETPPGVAAVVRRPEVDEAALLRAAAAPLVVVVAGVRDPGNLGAVLRTAEAAGATGVLTLRGGADPFRDKAVRGSMGSVFRL